MYQTNIKFLKILIAGKVVSYATSQRNCSSTIQKTGRRNPDTSSLLQVKFFLS